MMLMVLFGLVLGVVGIVAYPLYFQPVKDYLTTHISSHEFSTQDSWLNALSELEEDYQLGRTSQADYERLKLYFQRRYLETKQASSQNNVK